MRLPILIPLICLAITIASSQEVNADNVFGLETKTSTLENIASLLEKHYIFLDKAKEAGDFLQAEFAAGNLESDTIPAFATALTQSLQEVTKDKHLRVLPIPSAGVPPSRDQVLSYWYRNTNMQRTSNYGFQEVKILPGNIGYLDLRTFAPPALAKVRADGAMSILENTSAIIIDLRNNGGGSPEMVQYLCSFFFDQQLLLNSLYWRDRDETTEFWVLENVNGEKRPNTPLFILTSSRTFSGAEEFTYNMQTRKRASIIGETTRGGAHPGSSFSVNDYYQIFIPTGRAINPITQTNWEGIGVVPEIVIDADDAFDEALKLARIAANKETAIYKRLYDDVIGSIWDGLLNAEHLLERHQPVEAQQQTTRIIKNALDKNVASSDSILALGYEYQRRLRKPKVAQLVFKTGIDIAEDPLRFHIALGRTLKELKLYGEAVEEFNKALIIAEKAESPESMVRMIQENLRQTKKRGK